MADSVCCFHCGQGFCNWEPQDSPWTGDERHFITCTPFLLLVKGDDFIQDVLRQSQSEPEEDKLRTFSYERVEKIMEGSICKVRGGAFPGDGIVLCVRVLHLNRRTGHAGRDGGVAVPF